MRHRNDTIKEILTTSWQHAVTMKFSKEIRRLVEVWNGPRDFIGGTPANRSKLPIKTKLITTSKITSKMIRDSMKLVNTNYEFKTVGTLSQDQVGILGRQIKRLNNVKLKSTILRLIHGDIYCASRMKKFGMTDSDSCERCGEVESIEHMILTCEYTKNIWAIVSSITDIKHTSIKKIVGLDPIHDKTTLTINCEIVRQLLAITRPTVDPRTFVENTVKRLSIIEKGVTKIQILTLLDRLKSLPIR